jgi:drug/metabolite transporter (DMT)-like permease
MCAGRAKRWSCGRSKLNLSGALQLAASTLIFLLAATAAKGWALAPSHGRLALVILLYSAGNLIMLRLIRDFGMGVALSLSAVIQLVAVNLVAFVFFGERVNAIQAVGVGAAIAAVALISLGPYIAGR